MSDDLQHFWGFRFFICIFIRYYIFMWDNYFCIGHFQLRAQYGTVLGGQPLSLGGHITWS